MTDIVSCLPVWGRKRKKRGRKRTFFILSGIFACLFLLLNMTGIVFLSAEETDGREELNESILEQIGELDIEALQEYVDSLEGFSDESVADRLFDYIKGEAFDYGSFASQMLDVFFGDIKQMLPGRSISTTEPGRRAGKRRKYGGIYGRQDCKSYTKQGTKQGERLS